MSVREGVIRAKLDQERKKEAGGIFSDPYEPTLEETMKNILTESHRGHKKIFVMSNETSLTELAAQQQFPSNDDF